MMLQPGAYPVSLPEEVQSFASTIQQTHPVAVTGLQSLLQLLSQLEEFALVYAQVWGLTHSF